MIVLSDCEALLSSHEVLGFRSEAKELGTLLNLGGSVPKHAPVWF